MKRFLTYCAIFAVIVVLLLATVEAIVRHYPNSYSYKDQWMRAHGDSVTTLILGGSHSYYGLDPAMLGPGTFNLANVTQHPEYDYYVLTRYPTASLRRVILVVDAVNVFDYPVEVLPEDSYRATYYRVYMGCDKHSVLSRYGFELASLESCKKKIVPAVKYIFTGHYELNCDSLGIGHWFEDHAFRTPAELKGYAEAAVKRHRCKDYSNIDYNVEWVDSIGEYCRRRGIEIVVVTPPAVPEYYNNVEQRQIDEMYRVVKHITSRYGARYYDYFKDNRFDSNDFYDADHLADPGARKLTRLLLDDMAKDEKAVEKPK